MTQKVLKVGSSAAVTIPKKSLDELGLKIGDRVTVAINRENKSIVVQPSVSVDVATVEWARDFIEKYRPALEALARQ